MVYVEQERRLLLFETIARDEGAGDHYIVLQGEGRHDFRSAANEVA
jgi:hypothetical protein